MALHSVFMPGKSWKEEPAQLQPLGSHRVRIDTPEGQNVHHRELTHLVQWHLWQRSETRTDMLCVCVITESGACTLTSTTLQIKNTSTFHRHEIKEKRNTFFIPADLPDVGHLPYLAPDQAWVPWVGGEGLGQSDWVPLTEPPPQHVPSGLPWVGPQTPVHPKDGGPTLWPRGPW